MPFRIGTTTLKTAKVGTNTVGNSFVEYTRVYGVGEDRFPVPVSNGLISLYNPAYTSSAINGYDSGTIVDLWGDKDLETAGTAVDVRSDGSIYFYTSSYASSSVELSADLLGSGSEFTIIAYTYLHGSGSYNAGGAGSGRFKIGTAGRSTLTNIIAEVGIDTGGSAGMYPVSIGATSASFGAYDMFYPIKYKTGGTGYFTNFGEPYDATPPNPFGHTSSSFAAYSKADQTISYTKPNTNLSVYLDEFWYNTLYANLQKTTTGIYTDAGASNDDLYVFDSADANIPDVLETYITESYLVINPDFSSQGSRSTQEFALKGFAVYNRVLSTAEIQLMKSWFDESY